MSNPNAWLWSFYILFFIRYFRLVVHVIAHWTFRSIPIPPNPTYSNKDVTVVIPTISTNVEQLRTTLRSILDCGVFEIVVVTTHQQTGKVLEVTESFAAKNLHVFEIEFANKRDQVSEGIRRALSDIIVLVDDDVEWPLKIVPWILAPFEDRLVGAVGTSQRVRRLENGTVQGNLYNFLGARYIERRNFEISATHNLDGGTSCMSGRTCAVRSKILKDTRFLDGFQNETWHGIRLNADDDNFITRWLVSEGWKTYVQYNQECEVETVLETNSAFLSQCLRWARSNWRSNIKSMFWERHIWSQQPWSSYALHLTMFINYAIIIDPLLIKLLYEGTKSFHCQFWLMIWMLLAKNIKLIRLYRRNVSDVLYMPLQISFGYFHSFIKIYAACTLSNEEWGSREP